MGKKVGVFFGILLLAVGVGILFVPMMSKKSSDNIQKALTRQYKTIVKENQSEKEIPLPKPQDEKMDYTIADFIEENSTDETRGIIDRQQILGVITCETIDIQYVVVEGAQRDNIRAAIGHITGTAGFGGMGNCVLAGHRGGYYGEFFQNIHKLSNGDRVMLTDLYDRTYIYAVYEQEVVESNDLWICDPISGENTLTLLSCEDNGKRRRIVRCRLE